MKKLITISLSLFLLSFTVWQHDFETAKQLAKEKHQLILLNFSGSDWCGPCMRMKKEIFENQQFSGMADTSLVLYNADFPRNKKNQLDKTIKKQNEILADKYNPDGKFPFTLLLNTDGKVIKTFDGMPDVDGPHFASIVKNICNANK